MARLSKANGMAALAFVRFLILTATRTSETLGARWREIERRANWHSGLPAGRSPKERMKVGKPHVVPLSDTALAVLNRSGAPSHRWQRRDLPRHEVGR